MFNMLSVLIYVLWGVMSVVDLCHEVVNIFDVAIVQKTTPLERPLGSIAIAQMMCVGYAVYTLF